MEFFSRNPHRNSNNGFLGFRRGDKDWGTSQRECSSLQRGIVTKVGHSGGEGGLYEKKKKVAVLGSN